MGPVFEKMCVMCLCLRVAHAIAVLACRVPRYLGVTAEGSACVETLAPYRACIAANVRFAVSPTTAAAAATGTVLLLLSPLSLLCHSC
jgi:predicted secreted protein